MESDPRVTQAIFQAIDELNLQLPPDKHLKKSIDTALLGRSSKLDSLSLVNLILITEENLEDLFGVTVNLADQRALSQENNPYRTVDSLGQYITQLISETSNGSYQI